MPPLRPLVYACLAAQQKAPDLVQGVMVGSTHLSSSSATPRLPLPRPIRLPRGRKQPPGTNGPQSPPPAANRRTDEGIRPQSRRSSLRVEQGQARLGVGLPPEWLGFCGEDQTLTRKNQNDEGFQGHSSQCLLDG